MYSLKFYSVILFFTIIILPFAIFGGEIMRPDGTVDVVELNKYLQLHNANWTAAENKFSTMSADERKHHLGAILPKEPLPPERKREGLKRTMTFQPTYDWRNVNGENFMTPIRDQGDCGSCWSFAVIGVAEGMINVAENDPDIDIDLSEQYLVSSCCAYGDCDGGYVYSTFEFLESNGVPQESCYPYEASNSPCSYRCSDWLGDLRSFGTPFWLPSGASVNTIKAALMDGPLAVCFEVYTDFYYYYGGVYSHTWGSFEGWHAVALVGWDDADSSWICKNSWGTWWGDSGWFKIKWWQCSIHDWVSGITYEPLSVNATGDTLIFLDNLANLWGFASGGSPSLSEPAGYDAVWHPGILVDDSTAVNTYAHPVVPTTFDVDISDLNTSKSDSIRVNVAITISVSSEYGAPYPSDGDAFLLGEMVQAYVDSLIEIEPGRYAHCCGYNITGPDSACGDSSKVTFTPTGYDTIVWLWEEILTVTSKSGSDTMRLITSPNPCNPMAKINFYIPKDADVSLYMKDLTGRTIARILNTHLKAGKYEYYWDGVDRWNRDAPAGTYFVVLNVGNTRHTSKVVLVK